ncbi:uncharacterized protein LOC116430450 [Nomia melanderi]|uniref:uncharacterized protein LOC116430450 n=1 Tax=Nomia melanderi TaxID=2448451 RepID=UPI001303FE27|nr:uncharacterized protein LOC116430450 [Nomia melanderi]XP_031840474.1 uncharacterized protein LOC116430450 [Nomia melanderi]
MRTYKRDGNEHPISEESRKAFVNCMNTEAYKAGLPVGIISAFMANVFIRGNTPTVRAIFTATSGFFGYIIGRFSYAPTCIAKYVPEVNLKEDETNLMERHRRAYETASESETPWIEQELTSNDYYTNIDDNSVLQGNQFDDINNDIDIDDKPINLKPQKRSVTYDDLRSQHRASLYARQNRTRSKSFQDEELQDDAATLKTESTEGNIWF